jgi:hypothetical protein
MLGVHLSVFAVIILFVWRGRMKKRLTWGENYHVILFYVINHVSNIAFALIGRHFQVLPLIIPIAVLHLAILAWIFISSWKVKRSEKVREEKDE